MRRATLYRYRLPMQPSVVLGNQRFAEREGLLVALDDAGRRGVGEIAPLPGFSRESLADAGAAAQRWLARWTAGRRQRRCSTPPRPRSVLASAARWRS
ncbi:o-succinylbenzoate synthase [Sodalis praecaptivus]